MNLHQANCKQQLYDGDDTVVRLYVLPIPAWVHCGYSEY